MRKKLTLNEELYKMRKLMTFNSEKFRAETTSLDRLVEEKMVNKYLINEQVIVSTEVYKNAVGTFNLNDLPNAIENYIPSKGYIRIDGGNEWLANSRANSLKNFLISNLPSKIGVNIPSENVTLSKAEVLGPGNENQYVIGSMYGRIFKPAETQEEYPFQVWYNFYDVGGVPHIIVNKRGKGLIPTKSSSSSSDEKYLRLSDKVGVSNFISVKQKLPMDVVNYATLIPITKEMGWVAWKNSILYFDNEDNYIKTRDFIKSFTDAEPTISRGDGRQTRFIGTPGGGGSYIIGDSGKGATATVIYGKDKGKDIIIKRVIKGKEGDIPGETKEGGEEEWFKLGDYKLDKNFFKDNMISLSPDSYDKIFTDIRNIVLQKYGEGFDINTVELKAEIKGFASSDNATNRLPQGVEKPDHTYGNRVPVDKWIKVG